MGVSPQAVVFMLSVGSYDLEGDGLTYTAGHRKGLKTAQFLPAVTYDFLFHPPSPREARFCCLLLAMEDRITFSQYSPWADKEEECPWDTNRPWRIDWTKHISGRWNKENRMLRPVVSCSTAHPLSSFVCFPLLRMSGLLSTVILPRPSKVLFFSVLLGCLGGMY